MRAAVASSVSLLGARSAAMPTIVRNGTVYDGTGAPPRDVDVLIGDDGRITRLGVALAKKTTIRH